MSKMVVTSLFTDQGKAPVRFQKMKEEMTGSVTNPIYVVIDPFSGKKIGQYDYNQAKAADFAERLQKNIRRFRRMNRNVASVQAAAKQS
ncbi:MAG: hypothetical protein V3W41_20205 [Planctomycetota bacterium]